ncbi:ABC transporter ATP-binding protein [Paradesulfitobacterium aromaticivorans]
MLHISNLQSFYGNVQAVWDVSLEVKQGEVVSIIGANGAGKTTILKSIVGLVAKKGTLMFNSQDISTLPAHRMAEMGIAYVPEGRRVFPDMSVEENLKLGGYNKRAKAGRNESMAYVLELFPRLKERFHTLAGNLSGGEQQMLVIARGLVSQPRLLLLDEPSLGIAPILVEEIFKTIDIIKNEVTIMLVEQHVHHALSIANRGYVLEHGRIVLEGTGEELRQNDHVREAYLGM